MFIYTGYKIMCIMHIYNYIRNVVFTCVSLYFMEFTTDAIFIHEIYPSICGLSIYPSIYSYIHTSICPFNHSSIHTHTHTHTHRPTCTIIQVRSTYIYIYLQRALGTYMYKYTYLYYSHTNTYSHTHIL